ncbi:MAG: HTTM domain-containing protein [Bdellovibrio sp.]
MPALKSVFKIDPRSLGLFRFFLGLMLVLDTTQKLFLARELYSDWGVMPRFYWVEHYMSDWKWSLHLASGSTVFQIILIGIQLVAAVLFMAGLRPKITGLITLILLMSLQSRNNLVLSASDDLMRMALFFSLFLPLNARFSFFNKDIKDVEIPSIPSAALMLQLIYMYLFTAVLKWHPVWHTEGSAIYYAIHIDMYAKPFAYILSNFEGFMKLATFATLAFEFVGPVAALIPGRIRLMTALLFMAFHLALFFSFEIGLFPAMAITYWIIFLTVEFWESIVGLKIESSFHYLISASKIARDEIPYQTKKWQKVLVSTVPLIFIVILGFYNFDTLEFKSPFLPTKIKAFIHATNTNQVWNMFAPYPIKNDGWFVIEGTFTNGSKKDLNTGLPATYEKPIYPANAYPNSEWRKFMLHVWDEGKPRILLPFARFLCRKFSFQETGKDGDLATIKIDFVKETTPPPGTESTAPVIVNLWSHDCFAK